MSLGSFRVCKLAGRREAFTQVSRFAQLETGCSKWAPPILHPSHPRAQTGNSDETYSTGMEPKEPWQNLAASFGTFMDFANLHETVEN